MRLATSGGVSDEAGDTDDTEGASDVIEDATSDEGETLPSSCSGEDMPDSSETEQTTTSETDIKDKSETNPEEESEQTPDEETEEQVNKDSETGSGTEEESGAEAENESKSESESAAASDMDESETETEEESETETELGTEDETESDIESESEQESDTDTEEVFYEAEVVTDEGIRVSVSAVAGVLPENARLVAEMIGTTDDDTTDTTDLEQTLDNHEVEYDGFIALDVHFEDEAGNELEPDGAVAVSFALPEELLPEDADTESLTVQHFAEDANGNVTDVETVAAADSDGAAALNAESGTDETASDDAGKTVGEETEIGTVGENGSEIVAKFTVEGFSTFTVIWTAGSKYDVSLLFYSNAAGYQKIEEISDTEIPDDFSSSISLEEETVIEDIAPEIEGYTYCYARVSNSSSVSYSALFGASYAKTEVTKMYYKGSYWYYYRPYYSSYTSYSSSYKLYLVYAKDLEVLSSTNTQFIFSDNGSSIPDSEDSVLKAAGLDNTTTICNGNYITDLASLVPEFTGASFARMVVATSAESALTGSSVAGVTVTSNGTGTFIYYTTSSTTKKALSSGQFLYVIYDRIPYASFVDAYDLSKGESETIIDQINMTESTDDAGNTIWTLSTITTKTPEERDGYNFVGWFDDVDELGNGTGTQIYDGTISSLTFTESKTFYAGWEEEKAPYAVFADAFEIENRDMVTIDSVKMTLCTDNENSNYWVLSTESFGKVTVPTKENYTFKGWYNSYDETTGNGTGTKITTDNIANYISRDADTDITFYARWTLAAPNAVFVDAFKTEDGTTQTKGTIALTESETSGENEETNEETNGESDTDCWVISSDNYSEVEKLITTNEEKTKSDGYVYLFSGWYDSVDDEGNGTGTPISADTVYEDPDADIIYYAQWTLKTVTLTVEAEFVGVSEDMITELINTGTRYQTALVDTELLYFKCLAYESTDATVASGLEYIKPVNYVGGTLETKTRTIDEKETTVVVYSFTVEVTPDSYYELREINIEPRKYSAVSQTSTVYYTDGSGNNVDITADRKVTDSDSSLSDLEKGTRSGRFKPVDSAGNAVEAMVVFTNIYRDDYDLTVTKEVQVGDEIVSPDDDSADAFITEKEYTITITTQVDSTDYKTVDAPKGYYYLADKNGNILTDEDGTYQRVKFTRSWYSTVEGEEVDSETEEADSADELAEGAAEEDSSDTETATVKVYHYTSKATITLKAGETVVIKNLPDCTYTITETTADDACAIEGYDFLYYCGVTDSSAADTSQNTSELEPSADSYQNIAGSAKLDADRLVTLTNYYKHSPYILTVSNQVVNWIGTTLNDVTNFEFTLVITNAAEDTVDSDGDDKASASEEDEDTENTGDGNSADTGDETDDPEYYTENLAAVKTPPDNNVDTTESSDEDTSGTDSSDDDSATADTAEEAVTLTWSKSDGGYVFTLYDGQSIEIEIEYGYTASVVATPHSNYDVSVSVKSETLEELYVISKDELTVSGLNAESTVTYTNTKLVIPPTGVDDDKDSLDGENISETLLPHKSSVYSADDDEAIPETGSLSGLEALQGVNPDVTAWLTIDGTGIDYPVAQSTDNTKYVNENVYGEFTLTGSIFLDFRNASDYTDNYMVIYGHNVKDGEMFSDLLKYTDGEFFNNHPSGTLCLTDAVYRLEVFACVEADAYDSVIYNPLAQTQASQDDLLAYIRENAVQYREPEQTAGKGSVIALSTCANAAGDERVVVFAMLSAE